MAQGLTAELSDVFVRAVPSLFWWVLLWILGEWCSHRTLGEDTPFVQETGAKCHA